MLGGLCLFLFGMTLMGQALERRAGGRLRSLLGKMTTGRLAGFFTGLGVTAVIQSSSATTVMVVGFVNSGLMTLRQAINVIMGANVGTTVTAWLLSLGGISGDSIWVRLLKPTSFTPVLALAGIIFFMFCKDNKKKDTGTVLLGFATLMFGMETMSSAVGGLADVPAFRQLFIAFQNPVLGLLAGAVLTAVIQSSSASVGILQALAVTGQVSYGAAIPIIMGQNIGTCVTALLSSVGTNKNAKRAAFVHLSFNVIGSAVLLAAYSIVRAILAPAILGEAATLPGIAVIHTAFNLLCVAILMPMAPLLEKLALRVIHDAPAPEHKTELDERLLASPALALGQCREVTMKMADCAVQALRGSLLSVTDYTPALAEQVRADEEVTDHYEDILGTYLVKLSSQTLTAADSENATELLKAIGDFERIADHAVNIVESAEELQSKGSEGAGGCRGGDFGPFGGCLPPGGCTGGSRRGAAGTGGGSAEGAAAYPSHPADAGRQVQHRGGLCVGRPADGSGAHLRPLFQHRRQRHRYVPAQSEHPRDAAQRQAEQRGIRPPLPGIRQKIRRGVRR